LEPIKYSALLHRSPLGYCPADPTLGGLSGLRLHAIPTKEVYHFLGLCLPRHRLMRMPVVTAVGCRVRRCRFFQRSEHNAALKAAHHISR